MYSMSSRSLRRLMTTSSDFEVSPNAKNSGLLKKASVSQERFKKIFGKFSSTNG